MNITRSLQKWGNGTGIRLPKEVVAAAHIKLDQPLNVTIRGSSIILTPVSTTEELNLKSLLSGVTPAQINGELNWGDDVGAERYE